MGKQGSNGDSSSISFKGTKFPEALMASVIGTSNDVPPMRVRVRVRDRLRDRVKVRVRVRVRVRVKG